MNEARIVTLARMRRRCTPPGSQRGVVVFIALIVLVAMMLAGVATMRASGGAVLTAANLSFRSNATVSGDLGLEVARAWLKAQGPITLQLTDATKGYYATWNEQPPFPAGGTFDPMQWSDSDWKDTNKVIRVNSGATDAAGNEVAYVIHRMCHMPGDVKDTNQECVLVTDPGKGSPKEAGTKAIQGSSQAYFRVTARIKGPKNTVSYVQAMMY